MQGGSLLSGLDTFVSRPPSANLRRGGCHLAHKAVYEKKPVLAGMTHLPCSRLTNMSSHTPAVNKKTVRRGPLARWFKRRSGPLHLQPASRSCCAWVRPHRHRKRALVEVGNATQNEKKVSCNFILGAGQTKMSWRRLLTVFFFLGGGGGG